MPDGFDEQYDGTSETHILPQSHWALRTTKIFSAILFGLIIPGIITFNVMTNLSQLENSINSKQDHQDLVNAYIRIKAEIEEQNQYALASYMFASAANQNQTNYENCSNSYRFCSTQLWGVIYHTRH
ncbi:MULTISPECIES: hypothetical protein [unclassified Pseudoalteromonas]|uniref:hypothetical protein n=1 Tax=unclassified Pseudoalteromonas TaxID=194690 RepID=UPI0025B3CD59|nr:MULTISPECIES: hypothetical protein [unclassified Pseudoalteromonas]MDN3378715.1 hypothetical protein [Pseudoalteromonas sp. APC 3893]MDN3387204.1 hypothetical protein [Pseudoalteromonas sp. APC 4017]